MPGVSDQDRTDAISVTTRGADHYTTDTTKVVGGEGFEPPNAGFKIQSLGPDLANPQLNGPSGEIQTPDTPGRSRMLYSLSYGRKKR
jgi:hypothetical protein